jgi:hypothetical protein
MRMGAKIQGEWDYELRGTEEEEEGGGGDEFQGEDKIIRIWESEIFQ